MQEIHQPAPQKRVLVSRLTPKLKSLQVDPEKGIRLDFKTARCLREYGVARGWQIVQKRDGDHVIIWRIG